MDNVLANVKRLESLLECNGTIFERISHATEEFKKVCRTCLCETAGNDLENYLLPGNDTTLSLITIREILEASTGVKIETHDCLPNQICDECLQSVKMIYMFRMKSQQVDEVLKGFLVNIEIDVPEVQSSSVIVGKVDNQADSIKFDRFQVTFVNETSNTGDGAEAEVDNAEPEQCTPSGKKKLYRCGICFREYTFRNGLHDHIRLAHVQKIEKHCQTCGRMFRTAARLMLHQQRNCGHVKVPLVVKEPWQAVVTIKDDVIEIKNFQCSICDQVFELEPDFMVHVHTQHGNEKVCKYCKKKVTRAAHLENHVRSHSKVRPYVCPLCSKAFTASKSLRCHLKSYKKRQAQTCKKCGIMFCSLRDFLKHYNDHVLNGEIVPDEVIFPKQVDTESNNSSEAAEESFEQRDEPDATVVVKQEEVNEGAVTVKEEREPVDHSQFVVVNEALSEHDQDQLLNSTEFKAEPEDITESLDTFADVDEESGTVTPADASQYADTSNAPMDNEIDEESNKPEDDGISRSNDAAFYGTFGCPDPPCNKEFKYYRDVINHYSIQHCDYPPFACTVCQLKFVVKAELRLHLKKHIKCAYKCSYCPRHYWVLRDLKNHIRTHTGERPFQCSLCPQKFKQRPALRVHIQTHNTTKEYKCKYCTKEFFSYNGMFLHQKSHLKIKELQCRACNKQFPTKSRLKRHLSTVCGLIIPTLITDNASNSEINN